MYLTDETQIEMADFYALLEPLSPEQEEMIDPARVCPDCEGTGAHLIYEDGVAVDSDDCEMCHGTGTV